MRHVSITFFFLLAVSHLRATAEDASAVQNYVLLYHSIAQDLMVTTGVPASIKLAQGILESNSGRSTLAVEANNHFGIKCGSQWTGPTYYREDDDRDQHGKLKPSCFRVFSSAEESFRLHSEFLRDPRKEYRYGFLFDLDVTDYRSWAKGLKKSGYATNPRYADLLISLIEKYQLYQFDQIRSADDVSIASSPIAAPPARDAADPDDFSQLIYKVNGARAIGYTPGMDLNTIAQKAGISRDQLSDYNEWPARDRLRKGENIFIEPKTSDYRGTTKKHKATGQETIHDIAQLYGVSAVALAEHNRTRTGATPTRGKKIKLRGMKPVQQTPSDRSSASPRVTPDGEYLFEMTIGEKPIESGSTGTADLQHHIVTAGETLYSISRLYGVSVEALQELNDLPRGGVSVGQKIALY